MKRHVAYRGKGKGEWWRTKLEAITAVYRCRICATPRFISPIDVTHSGGVSEIVAVCVKPDCRNLERVILDGWRKR